LTLLFLLIQIRFIEKMSREYPRSKYCLISRK